MGRVLVFGAGGRAGRAAVEEAKRRGHEVTAAMRNPSKYADLAGVAADITDAERIAELAAGQDAVIAAVYDGGADPAEFTRRRPRRWRTASPRQECPGWSGWAWPRSSPPRTEHR
ncbi:NAD(P)H-binding protein [Kribbella qitaiheensis]|uniref:NAD(P)H-binding protein n=1 Tax=Kribbella qitaiheensis TaxID=1544730 RepID=UPI00360F742D